MVEDRIKAIEEEIRKTPYNKATEHHIGKLKAKLARLLEETQKRGRKGRIEGYAVRKTGDATAVLVGFPSVGKSTLLNRLTNAASPVAEYDFTTLNVIPGMMEYRGAKIQILDVPGLIRGASSGRGRGKEVLSVVRSADLILLLIDVFNLQQLEVLTRELYDAGIRLDERQPDVKIIKKAQGGVSISSTIELTKLNEATIKALLGEYKIHNADVVIRGDIALEQLLDMVAGNRLYLPSLIILNKIDLVNEEYLREVQNQLKKEYLPVSADKGTNLERLRDIIFEKLDFIRTYLRPQGGTADLAEPMILRRGSTIGSACDKIHSDLKRNFRYAQVWGKSAKFNGQKVGLEHVLKDGDIITIMTK
ncbi:MAG: GTP-binding protein [Candidatus Hydrothermarchaeota archaeon]|nr:GTP-binding protein [Candidatus Hydrothermarchaeota archaeon]